MQVVVTKENLLKILIQNNIISENEEISFQENKDGISSIIFLIDRKHERIVLKQSLKKFRSDKKINISIKRNLHEQNFINLANTFLEPGIIPKIIMSDKKNCFFIMTSASKNSVPWKELLLKGEINLKIAEKVGSTLAKIHNNTANMKELQKRFRDNSVFIMGRIVPGYLEVARQFLLVKDIILEIAERCLNTKKALVTADITPKNILVDDDNILMIDHEGAHYGDPSFDLGIFIAHIFLKSVHNIKIKNNYYKLIKTFWQAYLKEITVWDSSQIEKNVIENALAMISARLFGKLPVEYLTGQEKEVLKRNIIDRNLYALTNLDDLINAFNNFK